MGKIGIFGGTFDPVHKEHIAVAKAAISTLDLDVLYVVPTFQPPHKDGYRPTSGDVRMQMLCAAFRGEPKIVVSDYELTAGGKSYSYLTVRHFAALHPEDQIWFVMGEDMFENFPKWKNPEQIVRLARIAVARREESGASFCKAKRAFRRIAQNYDLLPYGGKAVSSTDVRVRVTLGLDVEGLVTREVADVIARHGLYASGAAAEAKKYLSKKRALHTSGVVKAALQMAKRLGVDQDKTLLAAALHDVAKNQDPKDYPGFTIDGGVPSPVVHAFLGEYIAREIIGVTDRDVLNAIAYHTSARPKMSELEKIVYLADMVEEGREYPGVSKLRRLLEKDFDKAFCAAIRQSYRHLQKTKRKEDIFSLTKEAYEYYCKKRGRQ